MYIKMYVCPLILDDVFPFLGRATVITGTGYFAHNTHSECLNMHKTKRGKGMHPEQNERGSDSSGHTLTGYPCDSIAFLVIYLGSRD